MSKNDLKERKEKTKEVTYSLTPPFPKEILIDISSLCNHACNFCSNVKMTNKSHPVDTIKDLHQIERFLDNKKINRI